MGNVRKRKEEMGGAELSHKLNANTCVCRCHYVSVCGRTSNNSYHLLRNTLFGFIIPKIGHVILPLTTLPQPSRTYLNSLIFPNRKQNHLARWLRSKPAAALECPTSNPLAGPLNCLLNLTSITISTATIVHSTWPPCFHSYLGGNFFPQRPEESFKIKNQIIKLS